MDEHFGRNSSWEVAFLFCFLLFTEKYYEQADNFYLPLLKAFIKVQSSRGNQGDKYDVKHYFENDPVVDWKKLLTVKQILLVSTLQNVKRTVWRISIRMFRVQRVFRVA